MAPAANMDVATLHAVLEERVDGFSCRTQIQAGHLGREGIHLAQLLAELTTNQYS